MTTTNDLLGYPADARLLLLNADDFGVSHSVNAAIIGALEVAIIRSTSLMVPCSWSPMAMHYLAGHPDVSLGVHLTAVCDGESYKWRPLSSPEKIHSLVDPSGYFYTFDHMAELGVFGLTVPEEFGAFIRKIMNGFLIRLRI